MNELQKMKLRMSRATETTPPSGGGSSEDEERRKKYEALRGVPTFFEGYIGSFTEMENELYTRGFSPELVTRTSLGKPFEPEEFELFLLRLVACVYN